VTKDEHIQYWIKSSDLNLETMEYLFKGRKYVDSLFFGHLHLEKICKALWIKNNDDNYPPRIHNLVALLEKSKIIVNDEDLEFLDLLNRYQLEGRYPDYLNLIYKETTAELCEQFMIKINKISQWLKKML
jgi:HEPN domain-containing protein